MNLALLGLGTMGAAMARRLVDAGHVLTTWNRTSRLVDGAHAASSAKDAVQHAELVITMLSDEHVVRDVLDAAELPEGVLVVEMSTIGRDAALSIGAAVHARGARFVDAPVSGSRGAAQAGSLIVLCGGEVADVERARPALAVLGRVEHVGALGAGAALKLVINALGAQQLIALVSALGLGERMGLDRARTLDLILSGPFAAPSFAMKRARLLSGDGSDPDFTIALWEKDQRLVLEEPRVRATRCRPSSSRRGSCSARSTRVSVTTTWPASPRSFEAPRAADIARRGCSRRCSRSAPAARSRGRR